LRQTKIESKIRKLEFKKEKILNKKKWRLRTIFTYVTYDIVMISLLILFIKKFINIIPLSRPLELSLYIIYLYIGVTTISISGAFISTKIESILKKHFEKKRFVKITKSIKDKEMKIKLEVDKQEILKKEITEIINSLDNTSISKERKEESKNFYNYHESKIIKKDKEENEIVTNFKKRTRKL